LADFDANVEASRAAHLGGEFAILTLLSVPEGRAEGLLDALKSLEQEGLTTHVRKTRPDPEEKYDAHVPYQIEVKGADHPGIVREISRYLADQDINIESMDAHVVPAPLSGAPLFTMEALVFAPDDISHEELTEALDRIGDELAVDIETIPRTTD